MRRKIYIILYNFLYQRLRSPRKKKKTIMLRIKMMISTRMMDDHGPWIDVSQLDFNQLEEELSQVLDSFDGDVFVVVDMSDDDIAEP